METKNKAILVISVFAAFSLVAISGVQASPGDIEVNETGWWRDGGTFNASSTPIQHAIDNATAGDTINVTDGTYNITTAINVNKGVTITGNVANPANVVVKYSPASTSLNGFEIGAADITIQGFKIVDCFRGVHFGRTDVTSTGCTITNCVFDNIHENAIGEVAAENTTISNNAITNCTQQAIEIRLNEATSLAKRTEVTGNTISSCSQSCIQTYGGKYVYIYDNTITSTGDKGINVIGSSATSSGERIQVVGNTISGTAENAIQLVHWGSYHPKYTYIHGNTISDSSDCGIWVAETYAANAAERVEVSGNNISYTYYQGIAIDYSAPYTYVYNNTLTKCNYYGADGTGDWDYASIHVGELEKVPGSGTSHHTIIDNNTISDGINGVQTWSDDVTITSNDIYDMGKTYNDTKVEGSRTYNNSGILVGSNWGSGDIDPTGTTIQFNNIYDNYWGLFYSADLTNGVTATNNWWGANDGPSSQGGPGSGDNVSANVTYDPWIVIRVNADPTSIAADGSSTSTITSDMTWNSNGVDTSAQGHIPDGTEIIFTTDKGSIGSQTTTKTTTNGKATATLTSYTTPGTATVNASAPPHTDVATDSTNVVFTALPTPPPEEVPAITPSGFLLALISLFGLAAVAMRKMYKR